MEETHCYRSKAIPLQAWTGFQSSRRLKIPDFLHNRNMKLVKLSALLTGRLYPPGDIPGTHFFQGLNRPQGHSAAGRIKSMKNPTDSIGNRNRDLPACSAVPQTTAPPRTPPIVVIIVKLKRIRGTDNIAPMLNFEEHSCKLSNSKSTPFYTYWLNKLDIIC